MKKSLILLFAAVFAFGTSAMAQKTIKLGHINSSELMQIMPGKDSAQAAFEAEVKVLAKTRLRLLLKLKSKSLKANSLLCKKNCRRNTPTIRSVNLK